jgi:hypothetical protein
MIVYVHTLMMICNLNTHELLNIVLVLLSLKSTNLAGAEL